MNKKSAADMTVEEFAVELMLMWDDVINIPMIERDKNNRSYLGKRNPSKGAMPFSNQTKLAMRRGNNGYAKGKYDTQYEGQV